MYYPRRFHKKTGIILLVLLAVSGSLFIAGCMSLVNQQDVAFLSSLEGFENESVTRIGHINEDVKMKQWDTLRSDLQGYQTVINAEIYHLSSLEISEKVVPLREKAIKALQKQASILQSVQDLPELNESVIPDLAGDYLSGIIKSALTSALSARG